MQRSSGLQPFALLAALAAPLLFAADEPPEWIRQAAAATVPNYPAKVNSVVLFQEEAVTVDADGKRIMRERGVVKIIQPGGEKLSAVRFYNGRTGRIRDFQGWLIPPTGKPTSYAKNRILDVAASRDNVYDEYRAKVLECGCTAAGSVFAWEVTEEEKSIFTQDSYAFQQSEPVVASRYTVTLPASWEAKGIILNREQTEPRVAGTTYTWELNNLPWIEKEEHSPTLAALAPRLVVSYFPPTDNRAGLLGLKDWPAVSAWLARIVDPPAEVTDAIRAKTAQLTAGASSELDKIRAVAEFVQQTNYVEVALNLTRGGGYTPRRAEDTLTRNYGDCKDKATLMRALLKSAGIDSYLVTITSGDRGYVRPEWASPRQFNHAIIAIAASNAIQLPTVLDSPMGRILIFDPTDYITPLGDLPQSEQGSYALVIAGDRGALLKMPVLAADARRIESSVEGSVDAEGKLSAKIQRKYFGQSSVNLRAIAKMQGNDELKKRFERGLTRSIGGITLNQMATIMHPENNQLSVNLDLSAERFGQSMQGRLFIVRPGMLMSGGDYAFRAQQRSAPILLEADLRREIVKIRLPQGFKPDEIPAPANIAGPYGSLQVTWSVRDGEMVMNQTLAVRETLVPPTEYQQVRDFFARVAGAQGAPVVLVRQ